MGAALVVEPMALAVLEVTTTENPKDTTPEARGGLRTLKLTAVYLELRQL
jgi:hypothetical protein